MMKLIRHKGAMTIRDAARAAGLDQTMICAATGRKPSTISAALDREDGMLAALIAAWEIMPAEQRAAWLQRLGIAAERPRRGPRRKEGGQ